MNNPILLPEEIEALLREAPRSRRSSFRSRENSLRPILNHSDSFPFSRRAQTFRKDLRSAGFPWVKTLSDFKFDLAPSLDSQMVEDLFDLSFLDRGENIVLSGPAQSGKTHLAVALGEKAASLGLSVSFHLFGDFLSKLKKWEKDEESLADFSGSLTAKVLVLDDFGSVRVSREDSSRFMEFLSKRPFKGGVVLTSRISLIGWNKVFRSGIFAEEILEHLLEHVSWLRLHPSESLSKSQS
ncbi:MAG: ATP-binding protein [Leptospirales bacterium]